MTMKYSWFDTSDQDHAHWSGLCPMNTFVVVGADQLPSLFPTALRAKCVDVLVAASASADGTVYYMMNLNRFDARDNAIDQQPFGMAFVSGSMPAVSGVMVHHGDWPGRTQAEPPPELWNQIASSSFGATGFPTSAPALSGTLDSLSAVAGQMHAFDIVVQKLRGD